MNLGDADRCGIKKVELVDVANPDMVVHPAENLGVEGCPGVTCNFVEVKTAALGTFSFVARATQNDDTIKDTSEFSGATVCTANSATLTAPTLEAGTATVGSEFEYEFGAFTLTGSPICGFKDIYTVQQTSASYSSYSTFNSTLTPPTYMTSPVVAAGSLITYPPAGTDPATCTGYDKCRKFSIDTSRAGVVQFTITANTQTGATVSASAQITIGCGPTSATIAPTHVIGNGSPLLMDSENPNYQMQWI